MFSIINDNKIAGISPFLSALLPSSLPATLFAPSRRLIVISHREAMEARTRLRFAFANHSRLPVYRLDALRPASLVEKRGDDTEIA